MSDTKALADPIEADLAQYLRAYEAANQTVVPIARSYKTFDRSLVPRRANETSSQYEERLIDIEIKQLSSYTPHLFDVEAARLDKLVEKKNSLMALREGTAGMEYVDASLKPELEWMRKELVDYYGSDTPIKRMLIDRVVSAWSMAISSEKIFNRMKYNREGSIQYDAGFTRRVSEARKGIESANNQIMRLTQALENLRKPPVNFKIKNAYIAQNQQINNGVLPKDLEKNSDPPNCVEIDS